MTEWDETDLNPNEGDAYEAPPSMAPASAEPSGDDSILSWPVVAGAFLALVVGLGIYWMLSSDGPVSVPSASESREAPAPAAVSSEAEPEVPPEEPEVELPALSDSDAFVRELLGALSQHPGLVSFLMTEGLARKIVVAVVNIAEGDNPARQFRYLRPEDEFSVTWRRPRVYVDTRSYRRYDALASGFASMDAEGLAAAYHSSKPLLDEAFAELGYPDRSFEDQLAQAIRVLLQTPVVDGRVELRADSVNYTYADRRLEALTEPQKQLLRTGPENTRKVQEKLQELARALDLSVSS